MFQITKGIEHVGGDMFEFVPDGADAILLKVYVFGLKYITFSYLQLYFWVKKFINFELLQNICHNWSDEECLTILRNCEKALNENGKVIIVEYMMPKEVAESSTTIMNSDAMKYFSIIDNLMFIFGGKERSENEFLALCKASGFSRFQLVPCHLSAFVVMEFHKW